MKTGIKAFCYLVTDYMQMAQKKTATNKSQTKTF